MPILEGFLIAWIPTRIISDITGTAGLAIVDAILALEDLRRVELMFFLPGALVGRFGERPSFRFRSPTLCSTGAGCTVETNSLPCQPSAAECSAVLPRRSWSQDGDRM